LIAVLARARVMAVAGVTLLLALPAAAQTPADGTRKRADAVRVAPGSIQMDGRLDDAAWATAMSLTAFQQREPVEGDPPTDPIDVRFLYDDNALYVGARMQSGAAIQAAMGRRDEGDQSEHFIVYLDTYLDRRTASAFGVTASGVRIDEYFPTDNDDGDSGYDPVWVARTSVEPQAWTAELRIPFSQLRFTAGDPQVWGLNIKRWIPSRNEEVHWSLIRRTEQGLASLFGELHGISGIRPARRIELLPYVASAAEAVGDPDPDDPFSDGVGLDGRFGLDAKVGIGSNLTLEATVNPDFGQVEADPAEVNLSAFETFFQERRPFFVEGANLLNNDDDNWFYSRRIGAAPFGRAAGDFVDYPDTSTILGAAKLTGRLPSGTSIGMLGAVTGEEFARTFTAIGAADPFGRVRVGPRTMYGLTRVQQEFGLPGSSFAVMATAAHRDLDAADPLASLVPRTAVGVNSELIARLWEGDYEFRIYGGATRVDGEAAAINRVQRAAARYLHRPDADYLSPYDPSRTSLSGGKFGSSFERRNARHWLWEVGTEIETPELEMNDIGRFNTGDGIVGSGRIEYRETEPGRWFRGYSFSTNMRNEWNFGGVLQLAQLTPAISWTLPNFWEVDLEGVFSLPAQDERLTRGGPSMERPGRWQGELELQSSDATETRGELTLVYGRDDDGGLTFEVGGDLTMQPRPQWQLSINPTYERELNTQQYITTLGGGPAATFGGRYLFAHVDQSTYSTQIRLNYTFKPDLTLDFYGEPFAASGRFSHLSELAAARTRLMLPSSATLPSRDFNVQSFRSNLVLRWEWRAGSTLYLVWQQDRETEEALRTRVSIGDLFSSVGRRGDNFFAIKASYWFSPR
jgi:hypothetical protein